MGARVSKEHYPFNERRVHLTLSNPGISNNIISTFTKRTAVDQVDVTVTTQSSTDSCPARLFWFGPEQTLSGAVSAEQWLTDAFNVGDVSPDVVGAGWRDSEGNADGGANTPGADTAFSMEDNNAGAVEIPPGGGIGINFTAATTALLMTVGVNVREAMQ
jgi:hypothetical protein